MRIILGVLFLLALFLAAATLRQRFTSSARSASERAWGESETVLAPVEQGWGHALVGAQSGVAPASADEAPTMKPKVEAQQAPAPAARQPQQQEQPTAKAPAPAPAKPAPAAADGAAKHVVAAGESLGRICAAHYGTSERKLVEAVAKANGLASPDAIKVGQTLTLPDRSRLR